MVEAHAARQGHSRAAAIVTGLDVLADIRRMTAFIDDAIAAEANRLGVSGILHKPFDVYDLRKMVCAAAKRD